MNEDRQKIFDEYQGDKPPHLRHPWIDYNRYRYSNKIVQTLKERREDFTRLFVVDYGSGVGDYGFDFLRNGAEVVFYDNETYINFLKFRLEKEPYEKAHLILINPHYTFGDAINLAIFGEVLEHLENPLEVITNFVNNKTKYIFTSSYPFRSDNPKDDYWHHPGHEHDDKPRSQQQAVRELLFANYERLKYNGEASLWIRK